MGWFPLVFGPTPTDPSPVFGRPGWTTVKPLRRFFARCLRMHFCESKMSEDTKANTGRRTLTGVVVSSKMDKTVAVEVTRRVKHARYHKYVNRRNVYKAHDESNECQAGDTVVVQESRPLSKTKRWVVIERRPRSA